MDACIFIMTINAMMPVYGPDLSTVVDQLSVNDKVCVTRIQNGWTEVHFSSGNVGHTGFLKDLTVKQNAQPTEPTPREEEYSIPAPTQTPPSVPQEAPQNFPHQMAPPSLMRPARMVAMCHPQNGAPYVVAYSNGKAVTMAASGKTRPYPVIKEFDDLGHQVFYVTLQRPDQERAVFVAFDYSQRDDDLSNLATQLPGQPKAHDKCAMNWELSK